jgi:hypothetical protein
MRKTDQKEKKNKNSKKSSEKRGGAVAKEKEMRF